MLSTLLLVLCLAARPPNVVLILSDDMGKEPGLLAADTYVAKMLKDAGYRTALFGK